LPLTETLSRQHSWAKARFAFLIGEAERHQIAVVLEIHDFPLNLGACLPSLLLYPSRAEWIKSETGKTGFDPGPSWEKSATKGIMAHSKGGK